MFGIKLMRVVTSNRVVCYLVKNVTKVLKLGKKLFKKSTKCFPSLKSSSEC